MVRWLIPVVIIGCAVAVIVLDRSALLDPPAYTQQGMAAFEQGNWVDAIAAFAQAQKHCETDILARRMLGMAYHNYQWHDEALQQYNDTWTLFAQNAALAMRNAGRIYQQRGEVEQALECYRRALRADPQFVGALADLGQLQYAIGRAKLALQTVERALAIEPENRELLQQRAQYQQATSPPGAASGMPGGMP